MQPPVLPSSNHCKEENVEVDEQEKQEQEVCRCYYYYYRKDTISFGTNLANVAYHIRRQKTELVETKED